MAQQKRENCSAVKDDYHDFGDSVLEPDKKTMFWMGGVLECFSSVLAAFRGVDYKASEGWRKFVGLLYSPKWTYKLYLFVVGDKYKGYLTCRSYKCDDWEVPFDSITDLVYLGAGAQGVVFGGSLKGKLVAVKKLRDKTETNIKHLRKLNHENIVRFYGVCTVPPYYCVIMEYCQYGPLYEFLHSSARFTPKQLLRWAKEIAHGMSYLHSHKIIHRDLKSPNVLISDNLIVKVSDFGTSREWNDVSATMSFTGTVAWMAPEVIRHELCSERVDVWSYGVVLWELLTQEVPYKNLETHAIMWGVGNGTISLPIPETFPKSMKLLFNHCWNRVSRNRPPFKIIAAHLDIAGEQLCAMDGESFNSVQTEWRNEVNLAMEHLYSRPEKPATLEAVAQRCEDLKQAKDVRQVCEQQLILANDLFMEVCAVRLQLEQRERDIAEREKALKACKCGHRKNFTYYQHQTSSSSDGMKIPALAPTTDRRRKKKQVSENPAQLVVKYVENEPNKAQTVTVVVGDRSPCACDDHQQNNNMECVGTHGLVKDTVVESNGNVLVNDNTSSGEAPLNYNNYVLDCAEV